MRILFVCSGNNSFGIIPFIKDQGESLKRQGLEVDYFPIVGKGFSGYVNAVQKLRYYLKGKQYDLIHAHYTLSGWVALFSAGKIPVVLSLMGSDTCGKYVGVNKVLLKSKFETFLTRLIQPFVKAIISKSANIERHVYIKDKSYIIPNGINIQKFTPEFENGQKIPVLKNSKKQILFLGNTTNYGKNYTLAKAALEQLNRSDVELVSPYPVPHQQVPTYLNSADVLVLSSLNEGSPNVIKEAMACNCPIVSTDVGDVRWVLGETKGCYIASFDIKDFSEKMRHALNYSETVGRTTGVQRILDLGLDSETIAKRIIDVYRKVLDNRID
jgi:teichuronic acid biosynthesis glycosyltransferase TuaC